MISLLLPSCSDDPASAQTGNGSVSAKVAGASWAATNIQSSWSSNVLSVGGSQISGAENKQIVIQGMIAAPGTYQINPFAGLNATYTESSGTNVSIFTASGGTLTVTELTSSGAKGTFSFDARQSSGSGSRAVTEGSFDVSF